ncbi:sulfur carrier protein ThiS [Azoarcus sp. PA01]|nr:sulfur carrier protein ThiS [Azoarcus sp. PA01]
MNSDEKFITASAHLDEAAPSCSGGSDVRSVTIELNGAAHQLGTGATLHDLIASLELVGKRVAVAVNREVVPAPRWGQRALGAADRVEIVVAIGGG